MEEPIPFSRSEIKSLISFTNPNMKSKICFNDDLINCLSKCMWEWTEEQQNEALSSIMNKEVSSPYYKLLIDLYKADKHIDITKTHQDYIIKTYYRLKDYFPTVNLSQLKEHDQSKYSFKQIVGYTKKFVHSCSWDDELWQDALQDHYQKEQHHPQYFKYEDMLGRNLEESVIDMIACHWERDLKGTGDNYELANINQDFLHRYTIDDHKKVTELLKKIQMDSNPENELTFNRCPLLIQV